MRAVNVPLQNNLKHRIANPGKYSTGVSGHLPCSGKHICIGPSRCPKSDCVDAVTVPMVESAVEKLFQETA